MLPTLHASQPPPPLLQSAGLHIADSTPQPAKKDQTHLDGASVAAPPPPPQVESDPYGSLPAFLVAYTVSVVVLFPCMIMQVMSGALYGFWMGLVVSWLATSVGQSLAFLLGRYLFRPTVKAYLHSTWPTFPAIDQVGSWVGE